MPDSTMMLIVLVLLVLAATFLGSGSDDPG